MLKSNVPGAAGNLAAPCRTCGNPEGLHILQTQEWMNEDTAGWLRQLRKTALSRSVPRTGRKTPVAQALANLEECQRLSPGMSVARYWSPRELITLGYVFATKTKWRAPNEPAKPAHIINELELMLGIPESIVTGTLSETSTNPAETSPTPPAESRAQNQISGKNRAQDAFPGEK